MDSTCETIADQMAAAAAGASVNLHEPLRRFLVAELEDYIAANWRPGSVTEGVNKACRLRDLADDLAELMEAHYPFEECDGPIWASAVRFAWLEFIAYGSAFRMYHDIPAAHAVQTRAGKARHPPKTSQAGEVLSAELVAARIKANGAGPLKFVFLGLRDEFGASDSQLFRLRKRAIALKLLP
jgi:hypothetical protein